jgi:hypothetical protein
LRLRSAALELFPLSAQLDEQTTSPRIALLLVQPLSQPATSSGAQKLIEMLNGATIAALEHDWPAPLAPSELSDFGSMPANLADYRGGPFRALPQDLRQTFDRL